MTLKVLGSSSNGNCYILENDSDALIIECGVNFNHVKQSLNFNLKKVVGCLLTHEHGDHAKYVSEFMKAGINIYSSHGTLDALNILNNHRAVTVEPKAPLQIGSFKIIAFDIEHDVKQPFGFIINHAETGNVLFLTDTYYCKYPFKNLNNIIIECNYSKEIIDKKRREGYLPQFLTDRIIESHINLETCCNLLRANDLSKVNNIVLIHLSDRNSDEKHFKDTVRSITGKSVYVAYSGMVIENFNKTPF